MKAINVLSLFDGMSCGQIALERSGIKVHKYYSSEIDKYAIKVTQENYPNTIQLDDIIKWREWDIDWKTIDIVMAGSPCQGFSFAGKQLNFDDPRSKLFFVFIDILNHIKTLNPNVIFLLENVKMKKEYQDIISNNLGVEPIFINSALVSAQSRKRLYWTNIPNLSIPEDKEIYLRDILEHGVVDRDKSYCIDANYFKGGNLKQYFEKSRRQLVFNKTERVCSYGKGGQGQRVYNTDGKSVSLSALGGGQGAKTGLYAVAQRGRNIVDGKRLDFKGAKTVQRYECSYSEKSNCLTSVAKDSYVLDVNGDYYVVRKLTPIECERLQTVPDNFTNHVSNSQRYKMLGNGWTVDVIAHIFNNMKIL